MVKKAFNRINYFFLQEVIAFTALTDITIWNACLEEPPTLRAALFFNLWKQIRPLSYAEQQLHLETIRRWVNGPSYLRPQYCSMSHEELKQLSENKLFTIGAHTTTHPALAFHNPQIQAGEIMKNKKFLTDITGKEIDLLAYPYGNYNTDTVSIAEDLGFKAAFTTETKTIRKQSQQFMLGRFQVTNVSGEQLSKQLKQWKEL